MRHVRLIQERQYFGCTAGRVLLLEGFVHFRHSCCRSSEGSLLSCPTLQLLLVHLREVRLREHRIPVRDLLQLLFDDMPLLQVPLGLLLQRLLLAAGQLLSGRRWRGSHMVTYSPFIVDLSQVRFIRPKRFISNKQMPRTHRSRCCKPHPPLAFLGGGKKKRWKVNMSHVHTSFKKRGEGAGRGFTEGVLSKPYFIFIYFLFFFEILVKKSTKVGVLGRKSPWGSPIYPTLTEHFLSQKKKKKKEKNTFFSLPKMEHPNCQNRTLPFLDRYFFFRRVGS